MSTLQTDENTNAIRVHCGIESSGNISHSQPSRILITSIKDGVDLLVSLSSPWNLPGNVTMK